MTLISQIAALARAQMGPIYQPSRGFWHDMYRLRPGFNTLANALGCQCHHIVPLVVGIDDGRPRISNQCPIHGPFAAIREREKAAAHV